MAILAVVVIVATRQEPTPPLSAVEVTADRAEPVEHRPPAPVEPVPTYAGSIGKNTSFFDLMTSCGVSPQDINSIARTSKKIYDFRRVYPGQKYTYFADSTGNLERFTIELDAVS